MRSPVAPALLVLLVSVTACYGVPGVLCADGRACPERTYCDLEADECVSEEQVIACWGREDRDECWIGMRTDGICLRGACRYARCGDGVRNAQELCDGSDVGGQRCSMLGYQGGILECDASCQSFDVSRCGGPCGNGRRDGYEQCDGNDLDHQSCKSAGWQRGSLACDATCSFDESSCQGFCGDGVVEGDERCDGPNGAAQSCVGLGAVGGAVGCDDRCRPVADLCQWAGWRDTRLGWDVDLASAWAAARDDVWAVGDGAIVHFDGTAWTLAHAVGADVLTGVSGTARDDVWAVGLAGAYHHDGTAWTAHPVDAAVRLHDVWAAGPRDVWAVGSAIVHHDGTGWQPVPAPIPDDRALRAVWGSGPRDVWAVGDGGAVLRHDGERWTSVEVGTTADLSAVRGTGATDLWIAGAGVLLHGDGQRWSSIPAPGLRVTDVWPTASGEVWLSTEEGLLYRLDHAGWHDVPVASTEPLRALTGIATGHLWSVGAGATVLDTEGRGWTTVHEGPADPRRARVFIGARGAPWALGATHEVSRLAGGVWQDVAAGDPVALSALWAHSEELAFAVGARGVIRRYQDGRVVDEASGTTRTLRHVWGTGPDTVWAVGDGGTILRRGPDGWRALLSPTRSDLHRVGGARDLLWIATSESVVVRVGERWTETHRWTAKRPPTAVWASGPDDVWVADGSPTIRRFDGAAWTAVAVGGSLHGVNGLWGSGPDDVWAVGPSGFASHWNGASWSIAVTGVRAELLAVAGTSAHDVWAVGAGGTVLHRSDALPSLFAGPCGGAVPITCGGRVHGAIMDVPSSFDFEWCAGGGGGQVFYRLQSPVSGRLRARLETGGEAMLSITEGDGRGRCQRDSVCREHLSGAGDVIVDVVQGETLFLTVSAYVGASPSYRLAVDCQRGERPFD